MLYFPVKPGTMGLARLANYFVFGTSDMLCFLRINKKEVKPRKKDQLFYHTLSVF